MGILKRAAWAGMGFAMFVGCQRDFSTPLMPTGPDTTAVVVPPGNPKPKPEPTPAKPDTAPTKPKTILIESLSASDLRMNAGEIRPAPVAVLPANATSPLYELTSNNPEVAEVTAEGIRGAGEGSATITAHALDGSDKTTKFHVIVDAVFNICLLPCVCLAAEMGEGKGKGKDKEKDGKTEEPTDPCGG